MSQINAERNPDGIFINTNCFREEALHFLKYGYYCPDPYGSPAWKDYWEEQQRRNIEGYSSGGLYITGNHYGYMNFGQIKITPEFAKYNKDVVADSKNLTPQQRRRIQGIGAEKIVTFPSFWSSDYNYFHVMDIARWGADTDYLKGLGLEVTILPDYLKGGYHVIVGKSRRKGYSYKNGWVAANNYNNIESSVTIIGAFDKKYLYPEGTMKMANDYVNFFNEHTGWAKARDFTSKIDHKKASYEEKDENDISIEKGYKSTIMALSFGDNPEAAIGKDGTLVEFEEAGKFPNLKESYMKTKPAMEDGVYTTGQMLIFGCVCKGTKVWTNDGRNINIEELKQKDGIVGYNGLSESKEDIVWMKPPEQKPCYRIETSSGNFIECSNDHPLMWSKNHWDSKTYKGEKLGKKITFELAENIKVGDQLIQLDTINIFGNKQVDNARLLGLLIGDGNYSINNTPSLSCAEHEIFNFMIDNYDISVSKQIELSNGEIFRQIQIKKFTKILSKNGMRGQVKQQKRLPNDIHIYNKKSLANLIAGYYDADGNVKIDKRNGHVTIVLTSIVFELIEQIKYQLHKFGIHGYIIKELTKGGYTDSHINYRLYISKQSDVKKFANNIHLLIDKKRNRLDKVLTNKEQRGIINNGIFKLNNNNKGQYFIGKNNLKNLRYETVTNVKYLGMQDIYNLTCTDTHTYISNGFITKQTGGDMESGTTDFAEMFYNPIPFKLLPFKNIWDENVSDIAKCGFFVPDWWNKPGFIDGNGNADKEGALAYENNERDIIRRESSGTSALNEYLQQYPFSPEEAFLVTSHNEFPVVELRNRLNKVIAEQLYLKKTQPVELFRDSDTGKARMKPDMKNRLNPIVHFPTKEADKTGCVVILEPPISNVPRGLYKAGYDPYRQDQSMGESLGAFYVYKSANDFSYTRDQIVAWYIGRPATSDVYNRNVELLAELYNLELMHENEVTEVKSYFRKRKKLHLLAAQPDAVISKNIKHSTVSRVYGIHMNEKLKDAGEKYIKKWLLVERDFDDNGNKILNLETITDIGLLQELISYTRKGNFDRVMAFMMVMFQIEEEDENKVYGQDRVTVVAQQISELNLFERV